MIFLETLLINEGFLTGAAGCGWGWDLGFGNLRKLLHPSTVGCCPALCKHLCPGDGPMLRKNATFAKIIKKIYKKGENQVQLTAEDRAPGWDEGL